MLNQQAYFQVQYRNCAVSKQVHTGYFTQSELAQMQYKFCVLSVKQISESEYQRMKTTFH